MISFFKDSYGDALAYVSAVFFHVLNGDPESTIIRQGDTLVYGHAEGNFKLDNLLEQVNVAIYMGLMMPLQKRGDWEMAGATLAGLVCIVLVSAIFVALGCITAVAYGAQGLLSFVGIGSVVHLALPMTVYWLMASEREREEFSA